MIAPGAHLHFIGIGGAGMSALAQVLRHRGYAVSGCDVRESEATARLRRLGIAVAIDHHPTHLDGPDALVVSRAIEEGNPEVYAARTRGVPVYHRAELLGTLMASGRSIAVVGTHGKTTTAAMLARVLTAAGLDPTALIGADVPDYGGNARAGGGDWIVAEVDESDGSLVHVRPAAAVLTSLDATDHRDFYTSAAHLVDVFARFLRGVAPDGFVAACIDHAAVRAVVAALGRPVITYGFHPAADVRGEAVALRGATARATLTVGGRAAGILELRVPGRHNIVNALGAVAAARAVGVPVETAATALRDYQGAARRFAIRGEAGGVLVVDDYAHNPVKLAAVLQAAREGWPERRLVVVFQPHRFSRTRTTHGAYANVFALADEVIVTEIYPAGERPVPGVGAHLIVDAIARQRSVRYCPTIEDVLATLEHLVRPGDLVLTLGAGDIGAAADLLLTRLAPRDAAPAGAEDRP
ncbi:MAG: UDP-N-acetylmuramate--L-alanine ligase [Armatimonadota bacterium]|nr:UDP-N-acetylmuramate--L-alanine ligase [Armatimonadota bacterium]MDR7534350.1 UDP-N-acetylmuramate--L-alanine ligase [Armatimonadota bacterium]MDR7536014.1 UDP-N-acetylmuramate--L-alanine ligase [Armatimonadota bacterium]